MPSTRNHCCTTAPAKRGKKGRLIPRRTERCANASAIRDNHFKTKCDKKFTLAKARRPVSKGRTDPWPRPTLEVLSIRAECRTGQFQVFVSCSNCHNHTPMYKKRGVLGFTCGTLMFREVWECIPKSQVTPMSKA